MHWWWRLRGTSPDDRLRTDGGEDDARETDDDSEVEEADGDPGNVEVMDAGEAEPADPKWEMPDMEDIPEFEIRADQPVGGPGGEDAREPDGVESGTHTGGGDSGTHANHAEDPTVGMPNTARSPGGSRIKEEGTEGYVAALELCVRLPEDLRLPEQAADLVPAAVEAELEDDVQQFAAAEFDNPAPHVPELSFVEADGEIWLRIRLGVRPEAFDDLDPGAIRAHALQELEGMF